MFDDIEKLWFWWCMAVNREQRLFARSSKQGGRATETNDVTAVVQILVNAKKLNDNQLAIMGKYGQLRRVPNPNIFREKRDAAVWDSAMRVLEESFRAKGWIIKE